MTRLSKGYGMKKLLLAISLLIPAFVTAENLVMNGVTGQLDMVYDQANEIQYGNSTYPTVQAALDHLLYVAPSIVTHTNRVTYGTAAPYNQSISGTATTNTIEIGNTVSRVELFWSLNKTVTSQSLAYTGGSIGSIAATLRAYDHTGQSFTTSRTYTLTVGDGTSTDNTPTTAVSISHKRYWGVAANATLTDQQVIALSSEFSSSRAQTRNGMVASGQYIYFAYPEAWGAATFTVNGLPNTDWVLVQRAFVNASGNSTTFRIYRSGNLLTGTYNVVVS